MLAFKLLLVAATSVLAVPEPTAAALLDPRGVNCGKVNGAFQVLKKLGPPATSFCRSYLKMPATSTTVTITTPATVTSTTSTTTVTVTSAVCPQLKRDVPAVDHGYVIELTGDVSRVVQKRNNVLPQLHAFAAAKISEGCGCLCLKPTTTAVVTSTAPAPTENVVATVTSCVVSQPTPPVCKDSSYTATCSTASECCSGTCGTGFTSGNCCNANDGYCNLNDPGACCSGTCLRVGPGAYDGKCI